MSRRVMVSADLMALLGEVCDEIMLQDEGIHREDWRDQCATSRASSAAGGVVRLQTNQDWKVAFLVWYLGRPEIAKKLPRER